MARPISQGKLLGFLQRSKTRLLDGSRLLSGHRRSGVIGAIDMLTVLIEELTSGELVDVYQDESRTAVSVCSVCAGEKAVFGHPCICGGVGTQSAEVHGLRAELNATKTKLERYNELIYAVGRKYPGESRSETARRYITQAETSSDSGESQSTKEIGKQ